jgi:hypothetical protein
MLYLFRQQAVETRPLLVFLAAEQAFQLHEQPYVHLHTVLARQEGGLGNSGDSIFNSFTATLPQRKSPPEAGFLLYFSEE